MGLRNDDLLESMVDSSVWLHSIPPRAPYLLLVESNEDDVFLTLRDLRLKSFRYPVTVQGSGTEALHLLATTPQQPVAILVSARLPGMSGVEFISQVRSDDRLKETPLLLLTSSEDERAHVCGRGECFSGADACLIKPVTMPKLTHELMRLQVMPALAG